MLIDTHAHLTSNRFQGHVGEILDRSREAGIGHVISIACGLDDSRDALALAAVHGSVSPTSGIHPCYVHEVNDDHWMETLTKIASDERVVAIGEIGLDYYHAPPLGFNEKGWRELQAKFFASQLELARQLDLPVVIHQRESGDDVLAILKDFPGTRAVLHCFTGNLAQAETALAMGHFLSFTGVATYPKAVEVREVVAMVPPNRFMLETDSPYLAPVPFRGKSNQPAYLVHIASKIAEVRGITLEECAELTSANASTFFGHLPVD